MLTLPIKKKYFDMILSGEKKEEYREITDYWATRFCKAVHHDSPKSWEGVWGRSPAQNRIDNFISELINTRDDGFGGPYMDTICLKNGYSKRAPLILIDCWITIGQGKPKWGAEKRKEYFILKINRVTEVIDNGREYRVLWEKEWQKGE